MTAKYPKEDVKKKAGHVAVRPAKKNSAGLMKPEDNVDVENQRYGPQSSSTAKHH